MRLGKEDAFDFIFKKYYKILVVQAIRFVHDQESVHRPFKGEETKSPGTDCQSGRFSGI